MTLGICVVCLLPDDDAAALFEIALAQIVRQTTGPFRIYGICPGDDPDTQARMAAKGIIVLPAPHRIAHPSLEHSAALDRLVDRAVGDGCDPVATFDMDSWPVVAGWNARYAAMLSDAVPFAAIVRTELGDAFPFAAFVLMRRDFWHPEETSFSLHFRANAGRDFPDLPQRGRETGPGLLVPLRDRGQDFRQLRRSNARNLHPVMGGLYDGTIFHFGAGSRATRFITDSGHWGVDGSARSLAFAASMNGAVRSFLLAQLREDHDGLIAYLAGNDDAARPAP